MNTAVLAFVCCITLVVAAVSGYHGYLHGWIGAVVLTLMAIQCWDSYLRGIALKEEPALEFLRITERNAQRAISLASDAFPDGEGKSSEWGEHEDFFKRRCVVRSRAGYKQAMSEAEAAIESDNPHVRAAAELLVQRLEEITAGEFEYKILQLFESVAKSVSALARRV
jgi:hypothetical protein